MHRLARILLFPAFSTFVLAGSGCDWGHKKAADKDRAAQIEAVRAERLRDACASALTFDRLKQLAFDEAIRIRNTDPTNLDTLATHSVVRMEDPVVKSRDDVLNVTVCRGRFILELPPGAERGFAGKRRLTADVEYAAHAAADGSGLVYQMNGAEPIIYNLAAFDLREQSYRPRPAQQADAQVAQRFEQQPAPQPAAVNRDLRSEKPAAARPAGSVQEQPRSSQPQSKPAPLARQAGSEAPLQPVRTTKMSPSFNCRHARTRSEKMVCGSAPLASLDRSMSSLYYSALSDADRATRAELRRSRDRFLAYREGCRSEGCVAEAYRGRMEEIRDIAQ